MFRPLISSLPPRISNRPKLRLPADLAADFSDLRDAAFQQPPHRWVRMLDATSVKVARRLGELEAVADAVADANGRAVELMMKQQQLGDQLAAQNRHLEEQARQIGQQRAALEQEREALARANVDAVIMLESTEDRMRSLEETKQALAGEREQLVSRVRGLEVETSALADANVEAVTLLEQRDAALEATRNVVEEMNQRNGALEKRVFVDDMTGLFNHRFFREQLGFEMARARRYHRELSLLFIDVDHFKRLNDMHGHLLGDEVLQEIAEILRGVARGADLPMRLDSSPFAARYGGEEFVVILPETDIEGARTAAERLRRAVESAKLPGSETQPQGKVTVSIGVATLAADDDASSFVHRADQALYKAKGNGRNQVHMAR